MGKYIWVEDEEIEEGKFILETYIEHCEDNKRKSVLSLLDKLSQKPKTLEDFNLSVDKLDEPVDDVQSGFQIILNKGAPLSVAICEIDDKNEVIQIDYQLFKVDELEAILNKAKELFSGV